MAAEDTRFQQDVDNKNPRTLDEYKKDPQSKVSDAYDRAKNAQQQDQQKQNSAKEQGSQQVANSAPGMNGPKPPQSTRDAVDRQAHKDAMAKDDRTAKAQEMKDSINKGKDQQERNRENEQQR